MFVCEICGYSTKIKCNLQKHMNRKTKCGPIYASKLNTDVSNINVKASKINDKVSKLNDNATDINGDGYIQVNATNIECNKCKIVITKRAFKKHLVNCKGVPKGCCKHCEKQFKTSQSKYQHQKTCKLNPMNLPPPPPPPPVIEQHNHTTINNNIDNSTTNNIQNNNITLNFGNENVDYLLSNAEQDPRVQSALQHLKDTMLLVYFNKDHPENQTVRKLKKKDSTMDVLVNNRWQSECCITGIPKLRDSLSVMLKSPKLTDLKSMTNKSCRELLYEYTKAGEVPESMVLEQYDTNTAEQIERVCYNECVAKLDEFVTELPNKRVIYGMPCITDLKNKLNVVREKYNLNVFTSKDTVKLLVDRKYMDPKLNVTNKGVSGVYCPYS